MTRRDQEAQEQEARQAAGLQPRPLTDVEAETLAEQWVTFLRDVATDLERFGAFVAHAARDGCTDTEFMQAFNRLGYGQEVVDVAQVAGIAPDVDALREALVERTHWEDTRPPQERLLE